MEKKLAKPAGSQGKGGAQLSVQVDQFEKKERICKKAGPGQGESKNIGQAAAVG